MKLITKIGILLLICLSACIKQDDISLSDSVHLTPDYSIPIGPVKFDFEAKSWDDVLGRPYRKGIHHEARRKRRQYRKVVYDRILEIKKAEPDTAIDGALFERVGRELGIGGKTLVEEYYYSVKKNRALLKID